MTDDQTPLVGEPVPSNDRGFLLYGGRRIPTAYGHGIRVQESSSAEAPHVWLFIDGSRIARDPHLNLTQAIAVHAVLGQFIDSVSERWENGAELLADARRRALGSATDTAADRERASIVQRLTEYIERPGIDEESRRVLRAAVRIANGEAL